MLIENSIQTSDPTIEEILKDNPIYLEQQTYYGRFNFIDLALSKSDKQRPFSHKEYTHAHATLIGIEILKLLCYGAAPLNFGFLSSVSPLLFTGALIYFVSATFFHYDQSIEHPRYSPAFSRLKAKAEILSSLPLDSKISQLAFDIIKPLGLLGLSLACSFCCEYELLNFGLHLSGLLVSCYSSSKLTQGLLDVKRMLST